MTIQGRKYTPTFEFYAGKHKQLITVENVQIEVDAGYEGRDQIILIEAKNAETRNVIIRQLYYPFHQWQVHTKKRVKLLFFEKRQNAYSFWEFGEKQKVKNTKVNRNISQKSKATF
ncbi:MAG: hypothetical protein RMJ44_09195 [Cytophagales bacterium]|nr:hypothetical protein [Bernardetiaceae bacterium]MDW8211250.1 hypothetical protein [Cytophagales bacterium]